MDRPRLGLVLLAAGRGSRMERPKLTLPWGDGTVVGRSFANAVAAPVEALVVVTGAHAPEVAAAVEAAAPGGRHAAGTGVMAPATEAHSVLLGFARRPAWQVVHNANWEAGMSTSLRTGVQALPPDLDGFFVALADMPLIPPSVYADLAAAFAQQGDIWQPVYHGRRGHPVLLPARYRTAATEQEGDLGMRQVLRAHADEVRELPVTEEGVVIDLDTRDEYDRRRPRPLF